MDVERIVLRGAESTTASCSSSVVRGKGKLRVIQPTLSIADEMTQCVRVSAALPNAVSSVMIGRAP